MTETVLNKYNYRQLWIQMDASYELNSNAWVEQEAPLPRETYQPTWIHYNLGETILKRPKAKAKGHKEGAHGGKGSLFQCVSQNEGCGE